MAPNVRPRAVSGSTIDERRPSASKIVRSSGSGTPSRTISSVTTETTSGVPERITWGTPAGALGSGGQRR